MARNHVDGGLLTGKPQDVFLGVDPSLTGFAVTAVGSDGLFESWLYKSSHRGVDRLMDISMWLSMKIQDLESRGFTVLDTAVEDTVVASHSAVALGELAGVIRVALFHACKGQARYPLKVPPTMVKKFATDRGNAKKNEVMLAVYKKWDVEFSDDNLADSFVIAVICSGDANTAYERLVLEKLNDPKFRDSGSTLGSES